MHLYDLKPPSLSSVEIVLLATRPEKVVSLHVFQHFKEVFKEEAKQWDATQSSQDRGCNATSQYSVQWVPHEVHE